MLITNVKPGKLRDVVSEGLVCLSFFCSSCFLFLQVCTFTYFLPAFSDVNVVRVFFHSFDKRESYKFDLNTCIQVLCASNEDHTIVEPLLPPEGAKPGERVSFSG